MSCTICGDDLNKHFCITLECACKSTYHYDCIFNTLKNDKYRKCPYCSTIDMKLPLVNGLKKIDNYIHMIDNNVVHQNTMCKTILKSGKNKGNECGKFCKLGFDVCQRHFKII